jgi:hypothetical protein
MMIGQREQYPLAANYHKLDGKIYLKANYYLETNKLEFWNRHFWGVVRDSIIIEMHTRKINPVII